MDGERRCRVATCVSRDSARPAIYYAPLNLRTSELPTMLTPNVTPELRTPQKVIAAPAVASLRARIVIPVPVPRHRVTDLMAGQGKIRFAG